MTTHGLQHLAVVASGGPGAAARLPQAVVSSCDAAARVARAAFAAAPGLLAFSWFCPDVERLLERAAPAAAARACADGARLLAETAAELGASLRVCGRDAPPPAPAAGHAGSRTLLWFRRYGGRDEIVRAAARFFAARPGVPLADDELGAWLDTAGVPDPDLLLFAGGDLEPRDALLWQSSYAELWHTATPWPSLGDAEVRRAVEAFSRRQRRFGR